MTESSLAAQLRGIAAPALFQAREELTRPNPCPWELFATLLEALDRIGGVLEVADCGRPLGDFDYSDVKAALARHKAAEHSLEQDPLW